MIDCSIFRKMVIGEKNEYLLMTEKVEVRLNEVFVGWVRNRNSPNSSNSGCLLFVGEYQSLRVTPNVGTLSWLYRLMAVTTKV